MRTQQGFGALGRCQHQLVAGGVAQAFVDQAVAVERHAQYCNARAGGVRVCNGALQACAEQAAVGQASEGIMRAQIGQFGSLPVQLTDVIDDAHKMPAIGDRGHQYLIPCGRSAWHG